MLQNHLNLLIRYIKFNSLIVFFIVSLILLIIKTYSNLGEGLFFSNNGVSLACAQEGLISLLHPGHQRLWMCSYDHQPLYFFVIKLLLKIGIADLKIIQLLNLLFLSFGLTYFFKVTRQFYSQMTIMTSTLLIFSASQVLDHTYEIRMYTLFLATSLIAVSEAIRLLNSPQGHKPGIIIHFIGFANFFLYLIPLFSFLLTSFRETKKFVLYHRKAVLLFATLIAVKLPYIFWWRVMIRSGTGHLHESSSADLLFLLFEHPDRFSTTFSLTLILASLLYHLCHIKKRDLSRYISIISIISIAFILVSKNIFKMHEIKQDYFIYLYPLFAISVIDALEKLRWRYLKYLIVLSMLYSGSKSYFNYQHQINPESSMHKINSYYLSLFEKHKWNTIYTEDLFTFQSYIGIFREFLGEEKTDTLLIHRDKNINNPKPHLIITQNLKAEEHYETLSRSTSCYLTKEFSNMFGGRTLISSTIDCDQGSRKQ